MPSLLNNRPIPPGLRLCFWDSRYIASQPFCITSKLTETELLLMAQYEEMLFWESIESTKEFLDADSRHESEQTLDEVKKDLVMMAAEKALLSLDSITSKLTPQLKHFKRSEFLTR